MRFRCQPADLGLLETAPKRIVTERELPASTAVVFELFADPSRWSEWFPAIQRGRWTSSETHQVGATRAVTLTTMTVYERFLAWEPGARFSFCFAHTSVPCFVRSMVEDYRLEPLGEDRCKLIWTVAYEPRLIARVAGGGMPDMFAAAGDGLVSYLERRG